MSSKFSSSTKSWGACNADQKRECVAHAVFARLYNLPFQYHGFIRKFKFSLSQKIIKVEEKIEADTNVKLNDSEKKLLALKNDIEKLGEDVSAMEQIEKIFLSLENEADISAIGDFSIAQVKAFLRDRKLAKIIRAKEKFEWTGSSSSTPRGKSQSDIGISDDVLNELAGLTDAGSLLSSWLSAGDATWRKWVDTEIEKRKREYDDLKKKNPKDPKISSLQIEIGRLDKNWAL